MANLGNSIINGILRVNGKINSSDVISAPSFVGALTGNANSATLINTTLENPTSTTWYAIPFHPNVGTGNRNLRNNNGLLYGSLEGTTSDIGISYLTIGNASAAGTAGNKKGKIQIYSEGKGFIYLDAATTSNNYTITFPAANGTVSLNGHTHNYLPLGGGTLTGNLSYNMNGSTQMPFKVYGGDANGQGISVGAGGATIVGSGESAKACESLLAATTEETWITSDGAIKFYTNCNTIGNKVGVFLNNSRAFYPDTDGTGSLGTSTNKWNNIYSNNLTIQNKTSATVTYADKQNPRINFLNVNGDQAVSLIFTDYDNYKTPYGLTLVGNGQSTTNGGAYLKVEGNIQASTMTASTFTGNLNGNASTATKLQTDINVQLSGDVTSNVTKMDSNNKISISTYRKGGCVGQSGNTTTKPWYKFASCTLDESYGDRNIVFNVYQGYSDASTKAGILIAHFRANGQKIWESGELRWLIKTTSIPVSDFVLAHNTTAPCKVELWCKCSSTYAGYHFDVISEGTRNNRGNYWTLHTNFSAGSQDAITSGYKQITSTVNKQSIEINTRNTTDSWIPVLKGGELQYTTRVFATSKTHTNHNTEQDRIPTLSFLSYWNGAYNSNNNSNLTYAHQGEIQCKPISLYDNSSGTTGTVTLSQTAANFSYLEIFFSRNTNNGYDCTKIYSPNGKKANLNLTEISPNGVILYNALVTISGTSITFNGGRGLAIYGVSGSGSNVWCDGYADDNEIKIYRVIGYK